jgi:hypothetical protein
MEFSSVALIVATGLGPVLAVQAQKFVEHATARAQRKAWVFNTLMATRGARLSGDHVRALNTIETAFYGSHHFGLRRQTGAEKNVVNRWQTYLVHLNTACPVEAGDALNAWMAAYDERFQLLLQAIATERKFEFDPMRLKLGTYSPVAHAAIEAQRAALRMATLQLLSGQTALRVMPGQPPAAPPPAPPIEDNPYVAR